MEDRQNKIKHRLEEILSPQKGYFGRIITGGKGPAKYEYVGYELSSDFSETLEHMSAEQLKNLVKIINYFSIHADPLRRLIFIDENKDEGVDRFCSDLAWQHFITVVMFGMLEVATKESKYASLDKNGNLKNKEASIINFLKNTLPCELQEDITQRYKTEKIFGKEERFKTFSEVISHLWKKVRSGFIHDAGIETRGFEWHTLEGTGSKEIPIMMKSHVPMQELLQISWQAILNSYGYTGSLQLPKYKN